MNYRSGGEHGEFDNSQPIYMQIIADFKKRILRGELQQGDKIPSQRDYAQEVRVNPNTVQRAYREMEAMRMVETLRGQGTFITAGEEMKQVMIEETASSLLRHFLEEMKSLGYENRQIMELLKREMHVLEEVETGD